MPTIQVYDKFGSSELEAFRLVIVDSISAQFKEFPGVLQELHKYVTLGEINRVRLECFRKINNSLNWEELVNSLCGEELSALLGRDLLIQSKINLSIQMPNDPTSVLPLHSDCWSADSPFQLNIWIPLTRAYSSNSMFIFTADETLSVMKKIVSSDDAGLQAIDKLAVDEGRFINLSYGQILIFNPALLHGNALNTTGETRVSLNVRVKSVFAPEPGARNPDRRVGTYYKTLNMSNDTRFALRFIETGILK